MSTLKCNEPESMADPSKAVETVIVPRSRDIGGFDVRRVLPSARRRMVGPFVFLDQFGPTVFKAGQGLDVRPHPHIGLATLTYLIEGAIVHRDSLGTVQTIEPGALNWMTAGRGIVHSERSDVELRKKPQPLSGLQIWIALPKAHEETAPGFSHYAEADLPIMEGDGVHARVIAGSLFGRTSPVRTFSDLFYAVAVVGKGKTLVVPAEHEERGVFLIDGPAVVDGERFKAHTFLVLAPGRDIRIDTPEGATIALLGGEPMDGPRHIFWNFVSSSKERIEQAKQDWTRDRFGVQVPGEVEFIPLPEGP